MSKICSICGEEVGFFSGKFIADKYVCSTCYEVNKKRKLSESQQDNDREEHPWTKIAEAYSKACTYKPWSGGSDKKDK